MPLNAPIVAALADAAMVPALAGNLYPVPEARHQKLPYIYIGYLAGFGWFLVSAWIRKAVLAESYRLPASL
jgi:hypothetical protein